MDDASKLFAQFIKIKDGTPVREALDEYDSEVVERGAKAVAESVMDAEKILMGIHQTIHAQKGLKA